MAAEPPRPTEAELEILTVLWSLGPATVREVYHAISRATFQGRAVAQVNPTLCQGCGVCAATCPAGAITQPGYTDQQILAEIEGALAFQKSSEVQAPLASP